MKIMSGSRIADFSSETIDKWHEDAAKRPEDYVIVNDNIRRIRELGAHRDDLAQVIEELIRTNAEMWHEEDKVRSENDQTVLKAIRNLNPLNQHRNDLIEEIDEIILDAVNNKTEVEWSK